MGTRAENYEYQGMIAENWDLLRGDTSQWTSRPYFLKLIQEQGEPALDVGCGTGRLLLDYLSLGIDIDGVDYSPDMIDQCRAKALRDGLKPTLYVQSMEALDLPRRYKTIIVPSCSFQHLTHRNDVHHALQRFLAHLQPGGLLAMSFKVFEPESSAEEWELDGEAVRPSDGALVRRFFRCSYDTTHRLQSTEDRYEIIRGDQIVQSQTFVSSPYLTWYRASEALDLLNAAGFVDSRVYANFSDAPATDEDVSYVVLGRRPSEQGTTQTVRPWP